MSERTSPPRAPSGAARARRPRPPRPLPRRTLVAIILVAIAALIVSAAWFATPHGPAGPLDRADVVARARAWTDIGVPYNQLTHRDGYRMDCSGFVSMAWDLPENLTTWRIPLVAERIKKRDLRPGDVLLDYTSDNKHVVIFERWANLSRTRYVGLELTGQDGVDGAVRRELPYPYRINASHYLPWRYIGMGAYWDEVPRSSRQPVDGYDGSVATPGDEP